MKGGRWFTILLGFVCLVCGIGVLCTYFYYDKQLMNRMAAAVERSTVYISHETDEVTQVVDSEIIESVSRDQELLEVSTYTNVLEIESLGIKAYINDGVDDLSLNSGVGRHPTTAEVGMIGNCVIAGHASETYHCIFNRLHEIAVLDTFILYDASGIPHVYYVTDKYVCEPDNVGILYDTGENLSVCTLYTCTDGGKKRLVVQGKEFNDVELEAFLHEYHNGRVSELMRMFDSQQIEPITRELMLRSQPKTRTYDVKYLWGSSNSSTTVQNMYRVVPGSFSFQKQHDFSSGYLTVGVKLKIKGV